MPRTSLLTNDWMGDGLTSCASAAAALPPGGADGPRNLAPAAPPGEAERAAVSSKRGLGCRRAWQLPLRDIRWKAPRQPEMRGCDPRSHGAAQKHREDRIADSPEVDTDAG